MSAQLSQTPKDSKYSFKSVLERLYENDAELRKRITKYKNAQEYREDILLKVQEDILFQMILTTINQLLKAQEDDEEILLKAQEDDEEILLKAQEDDEEILLKAQEDYE